MKIQNMNIFDTKMATLGAGKCNFLSNSPENLIKMAHVQFNVQRKISQ